MSKQSQFLSTMVDPQRSKVPLSSVILLIYDDGKIVFEEAVGARQFDPASGAPLLPATIDTKFRIASISKWVMTLGMLGLVERGELSFEDHLDQYLSFLLRSPSQSDIPIAISHLLSHTSTIHDGSLYSIPIPNTIEAFFNSGTRFYEDGAHFLSQGKIGRTFNYANLNYGVVATLLELGTGQRFDQWIRSSLFDPLGLNASFNVADFIDNQLEQVAPIYRFINGRWVAQVDDFSSHLPQPLGRVENPDSDSGGTVTLKHRVQLDEYQVGTNGTIFSPQGGLRISARDLGKILELIFDNRFSQMGCTSATFQAMLTPRWNLQDDAWNGEHYNGLMRQWGLSTQIFSHTGDGKRGDRFLPDCHFPLPWYGHLGDAYGLLSGLLFEPQRKQGVVYIIGGTPKDQSVYPGRYSSFTGWEEEILQFAFKRLGYA